MRGAPSSSNLQPEQGCVGGWGRMGCVVVYALVDGYEGHMGCAGWGMGCGGMGDGVWGDGGWGVGGWGMGCGNTGCVIKHD